MSGFPDLENCKHKHVAKNPIGTSLPPIVVEESKNIGTTTVIEKQIGDYKHAMECINGLENTTSTISSYTQPLVAAWNNKGFHSDSDRVSLLSFPCKHFFISILNMLIFNFLPFKFTQEVHFFSIAMPVNHKKNL